MKNLLFLFSILIVTNVFGQIKSVNESKKNRLHIVENKGQITDQYGNKRKDIQFKTGSNGTHIFIGNGQLHYEWTKKQVNPTNIYSSSKGSLSNLVNRRTIDIANYKYDIYRLDMVLVGANTLAKAIKEEQQDYFENYHTIALQNKNACANTFNKITYQNIYPFIDWVLYIKDNKLEYDFIIKPGGKVNDIKIRYLGSDAIIPFAGNIKITTPYGKVEEQKLYAYEKNTKNEVAIKYALHHNNLCFKTEKYNGTLVIDPQIAWGTYFGDASEDFAFNNTCDKAGNIYICGFTESVSNIATIGAYQTILNGGLIDAFLAKFTTDGGLLWSTYFGGGSEDVAEGIICDSNNNVYITGYTGSATNIATAGSHQTVYGGNKDAFLAQFSSTGSLNWATYYGGNYADGCSGLAIDAEQNIYMCGGGGSTNNIATLGSFQDTVAIPNTENTYLAKFKNNGSLIWATYFGLITGASGASACICDKQNNIYIAGCTYDTGVVTTPGCYMAANGPGNHVFIAKFDSAGSLKWSTYVIGDSSDYASGITRDDSNNIYVAGYTTSINGITSVGAFQSLFGGGAEDAFLIKLNDTGAFQWGTYFGGSGTDEGNSLAYDNNGHILLAGTTTSTSNIATTNGYQTINGGAFDAFIAQFNTTGNVEYASYYGGTNSDNAIAITTDCKGNFFLTGYTQSINNIATNGSYKAIYGGNLDAFLVKFDTIPLGIQEIIPKIENIKVYPNPNKGIFTFSATLTDTTKEVLIEIINITGQIVDKYILQAHNGILKYEINKNGIQSGTYFIKIILNKKNTLIKFTIN